MYVCVCLLQVVTGCDSSAIAVWDIETGNKAIVFSNAHGDEEITCMVFDETWRRLISGARNGTIKVCMTVSSEAPHLSYSAFSRGVKEASCYGVVPKGLLTFLGSLYKEVAKTTSGTLVYRFERHTARKKFLPSKNTVSST